MKYKVGSLVLLKQAGKLIRCVVIDIDTELVTLRMEYHKGLGCDIKINVNSEDIIKPSGLRVDGFDYKEDNGFFRAWCKMKKDRFKVSIYQNEEIITISVQDVLNKMKQIKSYQKSSLISIDININIFLQNEIEKLKNKLKNMHKTNN